MKIYSSSMYGRGTIFVSPGADHPESSDWIQVRSDSEGRLVREPIQFAVKFEEGVAEVSEELGRYMIDRKLASKRPQRIVLPPQEVLVSGAPEYPPPREVGRPLSFFMPGARPA